MREGGRGYHGKGRERTGEEECREGADGGREGRKARKGGVAREENFNGRNEWRDRCGARQTGWATAAVGMLTPGAG